jgi:O-antigen/teichoic acid export membrane protein
VSWLYHEPQLFPLLLVAGSSSVIRGFNSTRMAVLNRQVNLGYLTRMEVMTQVISVFATILSAYLLRSVWALLIGWLVGDVVRLVLSHTFLPGHSNRLAWDREAARELIRVGRWVIIGTAATYAVQQFDRLALGRLFSMEALGLYSLALFITGAVLTISQTIGSRVLFPMLSETLREDPHRLSARVRKVRTFCLVPTTAVLVVLAIAGEFLIRILYPPQYHGCGWMLRILASGAILAAINKSYIMVWLALGEFRVNTAIMGVQMLILLAAMLAGFAIHGVVGFVIGVALVELVVFPLQAGLIRRRHLWQPRLDLTLMVVEGTLIGLGFWLLRPAIPF